MTTRSRAAAHQDLDLRHGGGAVSNVFGNFFLKRGMPAELPDPFAYITVLFRPWVTWRGVADPVDALPHDAPELGGSELRAAGDVHRLRAGGAHGPLFSGGADRTAERWAGIVLIVAGVTLVRLGRRGATAPARREAGDEPWQRAFAPQA